MFSVTPRKTSMRNTVQNQCSLANAQKLLTGSIALRQLLLQGHHGSPFAWSLNVLDENPPRLFLNKEGDFDGEDNA